MNFAAGVALWGSVTGNETIRDFGAYLYTTEMIHGINFLPITPASLYLGRHPDYVQANYDEVVVENGGEPDNWVDIMWEYLALTDPVTALGRFNDNPNYEIEGGESRENTYYWLQALLALGELDPTVTADCPHYAVFNTADGVNYVFYNQDEVARTIHFSDGRSVTAAPRKAGVYKWVDGSAELAPKGFRPRRNCWAPIRIPSTRARPSPSRFRGRFR